MARIVGVQLTPNLNLAATKPRRVLLQHLALGLQQLCSVVFQNLLLRRVLWRWSERLVWVGRVVRSVRHQPLRENNRRRSHLPCRVTRAGTNITSVQPWPLIPGGGAGRHDNPSDGGGAHPRNRMSAVARHLSGPELAA